MVLTLDMERKIVAEFRRELQISRIGLGGGQMPSGHRGPVAFFFLQMKLRLKYLCYFPFKGFSFIPAPCWRHSRNPLSVEFVRFPRPLPSVCPDHSVDFSPSPWLPSSNETSEPARHPTPNRILRSISGLSDQRPPKSLSYFSLIESCRQWGRRRSLVQSRDRRPFGILSHPRFWLRRAVAPHRKSKAGYDDRISGFLNRRSGPLLAIGEQPLSSPHLQIELLPRTYVVHRSPRPTGSNCLLGIPTFIILEMENKPIPS